MVFDALFFEVVGVVEVSAVEDDGFFEFFGDEIEVGVAEFLPIGADDEGVGVIEDVVCVV